MILWIDAHLSPSLAPWLSQTFAEVEAFSARWLGFQEATDLEIFMAAREAGAVVMSKDSDFVSLLDQHGPPPQVIWVTCGNTSNARMREILQAVFPTVLALLEGGEQLVEISDSA